ncbi:MAG: hypothetical protein FJ224_01470 [Lentisphaerae bacterium]|nr:hypothetical protein [Lentisphaerota bacterium]
MDNILLDRHEFKVTETAGGTWREFLYPSGLVYREFKSRASFGGVPVLHITRGINPDTGRRTVARGIVAIGRLACGVVAIGQASAGVVAVGQLSVGILLAIGQAAFGGVAIGQLAIAAIFGAGQAATGAVAIGQFAAGGYVMAMKGFGSHVWQIGGSDPEAARFFRTLAGWLLP